MKKCSKCSVKQPNSNFTVNKAAKDGLSYWCKACHKAYRDEKSPPKGPKTSMVGSKKRCSRCKTIKELNQFHLNPKNPTGRVAYCKECSFEYYRTRNATRKRVKGIQKRCSICGVTTEANRYCPDCLKAYNRKRVVERHGLTLERYAQISADQNGQCAICKTETTLVIDHDHRHCAGPYGCGLCFRGLICSKCNRILGQVEDNPKTLIAMANYLK